MFHGSLHAYRRYSWPIDNHLMLYNVNIYARHNKILGHSKVFFLCMQILKKVSWGGGFKMQDLCPVFFLEYHQEQNYKYKRKTWKG